MADEPGREIALRGMTVNASDLVFVGDGQSLRRPSDPPIGIGSMVILNSGGPEMLVVDVDGDKLTCSWMNGGVAHETVLPEPTVHHV